MYDLKNRIRPYMSESRLSHTLSVAKECERLADIFGIDREPLVIAAYLHDVTKEMPLDEQIQLCRLQGVAIDKEASRSPKTFHAFSAPALIKKDFPEYATDTVLSAVRYHTTGKADMTLYEKLLFLADYIEPTRKYEECQKLREFFYTDTQNVQKRLDRSVLISLRNTLAHLLQKNEPIHPETLNAYNFLIKIEENKNG